MAQTHYNVCPRYTSGSPAGIDRETAERVAREERAAYEVYLRGLYGEDAKVMALTKGLGGIVYAIREGAYRMEVHDLLTNEFFSVPLKEWHGRWGTRTDTARYRVPLEA